MEILSDYSLIVIFVVSIAALSAASEIGHRLADRVETPVSHESLAERRAWAAISRFDRENRVSEALERF